MVPPLHKVKTRGAPKKDKKKRKMDYDVRRDPSGWEHIDAMDEDNIPLSTLMSQKKSIMKSTQKSTKEVSTKDSTKELAKVFKSAFKSQQSNPDMAYAAQFPHDIQRYIDSILDVRDDGNCGFRCIAGLMCWGQDSWTKVRHDLGQEMDMHYDLYRNLMGNRVGEVRQSLIHYPHLKDQPPEKWMSMPDMGHVIATRYQVALVMLSPASCTCFTFLPLRGEFIHNESQMICVGFVNQNHWVRVQLNQTSPMPPVHPSWGVYTSDETHTWYSPYMGRFQLWEQIFESDIPPVPCLLIT